MIAREELNSALRLLVKHKELFMNAHLENAGLIDDTIIDVNTVKALLEARLIWQPGADEALRISRELTGLFDRILRDPRRLTLDADIGGVVKNIEDSVNGYKHASRSGIRDDAAHYLGQVERLVDELRSSLLDSSGQLWRKINSDFGYVSSLDMKIKENETVLNQAQRLNDSLEAIKVNEMNEISGNDWQLRRCLNRYLLDAVELCRKETVDAIHKLNELLFEYRKQQRLNRLIDTFYRRFQSQPDYRPLDYTEMGDIPDVFNQIAPVIQAGHADFEDPSQELELNSIISGLRKESPDIEESDADTDTSVYVLPEEPPISIPLSALSQVVENFYINVIESNKKLSAIEWGHVADIEPDLELEIWLYAVISRFNDLDENERDIFSIEYDQSTDPVFNGKYLVHDVYVSTNKNFNQPLTDN